MKIVTPPAQIEKQLKREALYGCIIRLPVLEFVYLSKQGSDVFLPENMATLCPNHRNNYSNDDLQESHLRRPEE